MPPSSEDKCRIENTVVRQRYTHKPSIKINSSAQNCKMASFHQQKHEQESDVNQNYLLKSYVQPIKCREYKTKAVNLEVKFKSSQE